MRKSQFLVADSLSAALDELCENFGFWKTMRMLVLVVWQRRQLRNKTAHLPNHLRRDIGLPEIEEEQKMDTRLLFLWGNRW